MNNAKPTYQEFLALVEKTQPELWARLQRQRAARAVDSALNAAAAKQGARVTPLGGRWEWRA